MKVIETWNNPNGFSWITIEQDENDTFFIFTNNKNGVHRQQFSSRKWITIHNSFVRKVDFALRMNATMQSIMEKLMKDPEALERLKKSKEK